MRLLIYFLQVEPQSFILNGRCANSPHEKFERLDRFNFLGQQKKLEGLHFLLHNTGLRIKNEVSAQS
jgi:hypothetical protein